MNDKGSDSDSDLHIAGPNPTIARLKQRADKNSSRTDVFVDRRFRTDGEAAEFPDLGNRGKKIMATVNTRMGLLSEQDRKDLLYYGEQLPNNELSPAMNKLILDAAANYIHWMKEWHPEVSSEDHWRISTLEKHALAYLTARATLTPGMLGQHITASTLYCIYSGFLYAIFQVCKADVGNKAMGTVLLADRGLARILKAKVSDLITTIPLSRQKRVKQTIDPTDCLVLFNKMLRVSAASGPRREVIIQQALQYNLMRVTAARPMSLAAGNKTYFEDGKYAKLANIRFFKESDDEIRMAVSLTELKNHTHRGFDSKVININVRSVRSAHNLLLCTVTWGLAWYLVREAFEDHTSIQNVWDAPPGELKLKNNMLDQPLFLAANPRGLGFRQPAQAAMSTSITEGLKRHGDMIYISDLVAYCFRRMCLSQVQEALGIEYASLLAGHHEHATTLTSNYVDPIAKLDMTGVTTDELRGTLKERVEQGAYLKVNNHHSRGLQALLSEKWSRGKVDKSGEIVDIDSDADEAGALHEAEKRRKKKSKPSAGVIGKRGKGVTLTADEDAACHPPEMQAKVDAACTKLWAMYLNSELHTRFDRAATNLLVKKRTRKPGISAAQATQAHKECIMLHTEMDKQVADLRRKARSAKGKLMLAQQAVDQLAESSRQGQSQQHREQDAKSAAADLLKHVREQQTEGAETSSARSEQPVKTFEEHRREQDSLVVKAIPTGQHFATEPVFNLDDEDEHDGLICGISTKAMTHTMATKEQIRELTDVFSTSPIPAETSGSGDDLEANDDDTGHLIVANAHLPALPDDGDKIFEEPVPALRKELLAFILEPVLLHRAGFKLQPLENDTSCPECAKEHKTRKAMMRHLLEYHDPWAELMRDAKKGPKQYACDDCKKGYTNPAQLTEHLLERCINKDQNKVAFQRNGRNLDLRRKLKTARKEVEKQKGIDEAVFIDGILSIYHIQGHVQAVDYAHEALAKMQDRYENADQDESNDNTTAATAVAVSEAYQRASTLDENRGIPDLTHVVFDTFHRIHR